MDQQEILQHWPAYLAIFLIFISIGCIIKVIPYWQIFKKAGFPAATSLLMLVPLANLVILYIVAFSQWKVVPVAQTGYPTAYPPPQYPPQV
jgi:hypothetical protein